jgi:hypothetical protein
MSEPSLIRDYLDVISAQLPAPVVEELADGLAETYLSYLRQGLGAEEAAEAAVAEFGEAHAILAEFAHVNPARRAARRLLVAGPAVGGCWAAALLTSRAWAWPAPLPVRLLPGLMLIMVISLLAAAAFGPSYRVAMRAGVAGCIGMTLLDTVMIIGVTLATPSVTWVMIGAMAASAARLTFSGRALRPLLTS